MAWALTITFPRPEKSSPPTLIFVHCKLIFAGGKPTATSAFPSLAAASITAFASASAFATSAGSFFAQSFACISFSGIFSRAALTLISNGLSVFISNF